MFSGIGGFELGIQQAVPSAKCCGNAVTVNVVAEIFNRLIKECKNEQ